MLTRGRLQMTQEEQDALERLLEREEAQEKVISLTRTEPGEQGPIRIEIGTEAWHIDGDSFRKQGD
jgi:hypothetical protein